MNERTLIRTDELGPPLDLLVIAVERGSVHLSTNGVSALVLASRVELASIITILDVELGLVDEAGDHPILNETRIKSVSQCQVIDEQDARVPRWS